jgi:hypothetical protein
MRVDRMSPRQRTASSEPGVTSLQPSRSVVEVIVEPGCEVVDVVELDACAEVVDDVVVDPSGRDDVVDVDGMTRVVVVVPPPPHGGIVQSGNAICPAAPATPGAPGAPESPATPSEPSGPLLSSPGPAPVPEPPGPPSPAIISRLNAPAAAVHRDTNADTDGKSPCLSLRSRPKSRLSCEKMMAAGWIEQPT